MRLKRLAFAVALVAALGAAVLGARHIPMDRLESWIQELPFAGLVAAIVVLPLLGFPVTIAYMCAGARLGFTAGILIAALCTVAHLLLSFVLARFARRPVAWILGCGGWKLPRLEPAGMWPFSIWLALLPGVSYAFKNYLIPIAGVPFRIFFLATLPMHLAGAVLGVLLGGTAMAFSWPMAGLVIVYAVALVLVSRWMLKHVRRRVDSSGAPLDGYDAPTELAERNSC